MRDLFYNLWRILTAPFRVLFWLLGAPFRAFKRLKNFLTETPDDRPILDAFSDALQSGDGLWEHIGALRKHLTRAMVVLAIATVASFAVTEQIVDYLAQPMGGIENLTSIEVTESIGVYMRVAFLCGVALAMPYIVLELYLFIAPGLMPASRQFGLLAIPLAALLFIGGASFAYFVMFPAALPFLLNFMSFEVELRPHSYFSFVTALMFWLGIAFQLPLLVYILSKMGFVTPGLLWSQIRVAIVVIAIFAAVITPTVDPVNMGLVMLPMILLYILSIGFSAIAQAGRRKKREAAAI